MESKQTDQKNIPQHYTSQKAKEDHPLEIIDFCKVFMLTKKCKYNENCKNRHISYTQFRREMKKIQGPYKKHLCKSYESKGKCKNDKFFCLFAHGEKDIWGADGKEKPADEINVQKYDFRFKDQPETMKIPKVKKEKQSKNPLSKQNLNNPQDKNTENAQKAERNNQKVMKKLCKQFNSNFSESRNQDLQQIIEFQENQKIQKSQNKKESKKNKDNNNNNNNNNIKSQNDQYKNQKQVSNQQSQKQKQQQQQSKHRKRENKKNQKLKKQLEEDFSSDNSEDYETISSDTENDSYEAEFDQNIQQLVQEKIPKKQKQKKGKISKKDLDLQVDENDELLNFDQKISLINQFLDSQSSEEENHEKSQESDDDDDNEKEENKRNNQIQIQQQNKDKQIASESSESNSVDSEQQKLTVHQKKQQEKLKKIQQKLEKKQQKKQIQQEKKQKQQQYQTKENIQQKVFDNATNDLKFSEFLEIYCFCFFDSEKESQNYQKILSDIIKKETGQQQWDFSGEPTQYYYKNNHKGSNYFYVQISLKYSQGLKLLKANLVKTKSYSIHFKLMPSPEIQIVFSNPCKFKSPIDNLSFINDKNEKCYVFGSQVEQSEDQFTEYKLFDFKKSFENTRKLEQTVVAMLNSSLLYGEHYENDEISGKIILGVRDNCRTLEGLYSPGNIAETFFTVLKRRLSETTPSSNMHIIKKDYKVYIPDSNHQNYYPILDNKVYEITVKKNNKQQLYQSKNGMYLQRIEEGCWPIPSFKLYEQFKLGTINEQQFQTGLKKYDDRYTHVISQKIERQIQDDDNYNNNGDFEEEDF